MKHNDISALFRTILQDRGISVSLASWDKGIYDFANTYNGTDADLVFYINKCIDDNISLVPSCDRME